MWPYKLLVRAGEEQSGGGGGGEDVASGRSKRTRLRRRRIEIPARFVELDVGEIAVEDKGSKTEFSAKIDAAIDNGTTGFVVSNAGMSLECA